MYVCLDNVSRTAPKMHQSADVCYIYSGVVLMPHTEQLYIIILTYLMKAIGVALNIWEVSHSLAAKVFLLLMAVGTPECTIHLGPSIL